MAEVSKNGDLFYWKIEITNLGADDNTHVKFTPTVPSGMQYVSSSGDQGAWNPTNLRYDVGTVLTGASNAVNIILVYKVTNFAAAPFAFSGIISGDNADGVAGNNTITVTVTATTCAPVSGAVSDFDGCLCGDVSINDTACSHGTTEYRLQIGSLVNLDAGFTLNTDGTYSAMGMIIDLFEEASFQYSIYCIVGEDEYQTSGPVIQVINPLFNALQNFPSSANINKKFIIPSSVFTIAYGAAGEIVKDDAAKVWALDSLNIPVSDRPGAILVYDRPSNPGNGMTYEYNWIIAYDSSMTLTIVRIKDPVINYYTEVPLLINLTPGSTGNTLDLTTAHVSTCPGTTSWVVNTNSWIINKVIVGNTLTYDVHADAASGEYNFEIIPTCIIP